MKEPSPILILIVIFVILGLAYSPLKKQNQNNRGFWNSSSSIQNQSSPVSNSNQDLVENIKDVEEEIKRLEENITKKIEESKRSPFYEKIRISNISGIYNNNPNEQYLYLYTNLDKDETVNITGWYLKSEVTGYYATIGKASLLPFPFTKNESDIILKKGDRAIINKGFSPIGISFRTNKCTGFFEENRTFYPSLPLKCPLPINEKLPKFSTIPEREDECLDLIERVRRCETVNQQYLRDLPDTVTSSCKNYLSTQINYNSCVARHFGDTDFPGNEYRIFLNRFGALWKEKREKINLHDRNGLIVDTISY